MGAAASKTSRAAGAAVRKYPTRPPPTSQNASHTPRPPPPPAAASHQQPGPKVHPQPSASTSRDEAINLDASDPDFARSLRSLGAVQPSPTLSSSSTFPSANNHAQQGIPRAGPDPRRNPAIVVLDSRARLQAEADKEFEAVGRRGGEGRQFLDVFFIREILVRRDEKGQSAAQIEKAMGLKKGVVDRLGVKGVLGLAREIGREERGVQMV